MFTCVLRGIIVALTVMPTVVCSAPTAGAHMPQDCAHFEECVAFDSFLQTEYKHIPRDGAGILAGKLVANTSLFHDAMLIEQAKSHPAAKHGAPPSLAEEQAIFLQSVKPVWWLHVPKCGSSFGNVLIHQPGMCSSSLPSNYLITLPEDLTLDYPPDKYCPGSFVSALRWGDHSAVGVNYQSLVKGHGMIMLRQPEQRIMSGYNSRYHSWPFWHFHRFPVDALEYAKVVSGCAVRMLTRSELAVGFSADSPSACGSLEPATAFEVSLAKRRLREGFVFTGITDEWDLSICLFHAMFGGDCLASDFGNSHPTGSISSLGSNTSQATLYDLSSLKGYQDVSDGALFEEATSIFRENMQQYGVNRKSCQPCFSQASAK